MAASGKPTYTITNEDGSAKQFRITVDDTGTLKATEVT